MLMGDIAWPEDLAEVDLGQIEVQKVVFLDFGEARIRYPDETDLEWVMSKSYHREEYKLMRNITTIICEALPNQCQLHGPACRPAAPTKPSRKEAKAIWTHEESSRFKPELTAEQWALSGACFGRGWAHYQNRPWPKTIDELLRNKEMQARLVTDPQDLEELARKHNVHDIAAQL